jgi:hypothetical protein
MIEQLFFSCLQTGDDRSALLCLEQLTSRFGPSNERVMGLRGLYEEAIAETQSDLENCLRKYDVSLSENPLNLVRHTVLIGGPVADCFRVANPEASYCSLAFNV